jgi:hypothetical protein
VGAAKSGTTSLYRDLAQHPAIYMAPMKEPHYFSQIQPSVSWEPFFPHVRDEREYLALFRGASTEELLGEASTSYLWDAEAAERIKRAVPEARILVILRDPVERAYSHYWNDVREGLEKRSFEEALAEERERSGRGGWGVTSLYLDCGRYADQVGRYLDRFGEAVRVDFLEDYVSDKASTVAGIYSFLGLGEMASEAAQQQMNAISLPRNRLGRAMFGSGAVRRLARATLPRSVRSRLRGALLEEADPPPMEPATRALLTETFRPDAARLSALLGKPLPWEALVAGGSVLRG